MPVAKPSEEPTEEPVASPTKEPHSKPTAEPVADQTPEPSREPGFLYQTTTSSSQFHFNHSIVDFFFRR